MEEDGSNSQSSHDEDCHLTPKFLVRLAQDVRDLRERVEDILQEMREDGKFSEMTEKRYDERKSYLTRNLTELSRMQKELADQIISIVRYVTSALTRDSTVLCVSKTEESKSSLKLPSTSGSELLTADLGNEKEKIIELQKKVEVLNRMLSDCNLRNSKLGEELEASKKKCWCLQMEEDGSKSQFPDEDSHIPPKFLVRVAQDVKGLRELVEDILKELKEGGNFSEMTAERYHEKKSYLRRNLTEMSRMHKALADQMSTSHSYSTPIGLDSVLNRDSSGFCVSDTEDSKSSVSLSSDSDSETPISPSKLLISQVKDDARKDKEPKAPEALLQKSISSDDLGNEKATVIELQKEVADLKHALSDCNLRNTKLGDELEESKSKVKVSDDLIKGMKQKWSIQDSKESQIERDIKSVWPLLEHAKNLNYSQEEAILRFQAEISLYEGEIAECNDQIAELKKKNTQYTSELTKLKSAYKKQEDSCRTNLEKLRKEVEEKNKSVADLTKKLDTVRAEKSSQDNRIEDLETRLRASSENAQKVTNDLTQRVSDLEKEVDRQKEVISVKEEHKEEVIRQISSTLEYCKST